VPRAEKDRSKFCMLLLSEQCLRHRSKNEGGRRCWRELKTLHVCLDGIVGGYDDRRS